MLIQRIPSTTFTDTTLPKLQRDSLINSGTKYLFDFSSTYCWATQASASANATAVNLVNSGLPATIKTAHTFTAGGFVWPATAGDTTKIIQLPDAGKLPDTTTGFVWCVWLRPSIALSTLALSNIPIAGWGLQTDSTQQQYGLRYQLSNNAYALMADAVIAYGSVAPAADTLTQLAVEYYDDAGTRKVRCYQNGALAGLQASSPSGTLNVPTDVGAVSPRLGPPPGNGSTTCRFQGTMYRTWLEDTGASGASAAAQVLKDWNANRLRFG